MLQTQLQTAYSVSQRPVCCTVTAVARRCQQDVKWEQADSIADCLWLLRPSSGMCAAQHHRSEASHFHLATCSTDLQARCCVPKPINWQTVPLRDCVAKASRCRTCSVHAPPRTATIAMEAAALLQRTPALIKVDACIPCMIIGSSTHSHSRATRPRQTRWRRRH